MPTDVSFSKDAGTIHVNIGISKGSISASARTVWYTSVLRSVPVLTSVVVNLICQLDQSTGCSDNWLKIISGYVYRCGAHWENPVGFKLMILITFAKTLFPNKVIFHILTNSNIHKCWGLEHGQTFLGPPFHPLQKCNVI